MPIGIYKHKTTQGFQKSQTAWNKDIPMSKKSKKKMIESKLKNPTRYWLGKVRHDMLGENNPSKRLKVREKIGKAHKGKIVSIETRKKISNMQIGREISIETRKKMSMHRGSERYNWKGTTPLVEQIRKCFEYRHWREKIFIRDNWTCQECDKRGGNLEAHHNEKSFNELFTEFLQEYNQFSPYEDQDTLVRLALKWQPFWTAEGETLCSNCHDLTKNKGAI